MAAVGVVHCVYAVVSKDRFLRAEAVDRILREVEREASGLGPVRLDGGHAGLAEVLDEVRTYSLLGGRHVVVVEDADDFISEHRSALENYCTAPADSGCLILVCDSLPKNTKIHRIIAECGEVVVCEPPKGRAVGAWVAQRAQSAYGKRIGEAAIARLREHLGESIGSLDAELSKLASFVGTRPEIAPADVDAITGHTREENVFAVTDAIASGDAAAALTNWEQVMATDRAAPGRAIGGLAWAVRRLLEARREFDSGVHIRALAGKMFTDPDTLQRRLARTTAADLETQLADLLDADIAVKTGGATIELAIERFIVKHATRGKPATAPRR